jgi:hypothetical protein
MKSQKRRPKAQYSNVSRETSGTYKILWLVKSERKTEQIPYVGMSFEENTRENHDLVRKNEKAEKYRQNIDLRKRVDFNM